MTLLRKCYENATTVLQPEALQGASHYAVTTVTTASKVLYYYDVVFTSRVTRVVNELIWISESVTGMHHNRL